MYEKAIVVCMLVASSFSLPEQSSLHTLDAEDKCFDGNPSNGYVGDRSVGSPCQAFRAVTPGLTATDGTISFEAIGFSNFFLRHQGYLIKLHELLYPATNSLEAKDASFFPIESSTYPGYFQFQSENFPDHKIARVDNDLRIVHDDGSDGFLQRSLFLYSPMRTILSSKDDPDNCFDADASNSVVRREPNSPCMVYRIVSGLTQTDGTVSFESVDNDNYFLRHAGYWLHLHRMNNPNPSSLEANDASFFPQESADYPGYYQFVSENYPEYVIRRTQNRLRIMRDDGTRESLMSSLFRFTELAEGDVRFFLPYNGRSYIVSLNRELSHGTQAYDYCMDNYGYGTARIEDDATVEALSVELMAIQESSGYQLEEITTAERTKQPLGYMGLTVADFNPSSWHCVVLGAYNEATQDYTGDQIVMLPKKCNEKRTILCEAPTPC